MGGRSPEPTVEMPVPGYVNRHPHWNASTSIVCDGSAETASTRFSVRNVETMSTTTSAATQATQIASSGLIPRGSLGVRPSRCRKRTTAYTIATRTRVAIASPIAM